MSESQIASLLAVLSLCADETANCPLASFARDLRGAVAAKGGDDTSLGDILAERSLELVKEEERINSTNEMIALTHDKLRAEITRVEAQMREQERRLKEVTQQKKLCKAALNMIVSGGVPNLVDADQAGMPNMEPPVRGTKHGAETSKEDDTELQPAKAAPEPAPMKSTRPTTTRGSTASPAKPAAPAADSKPASAADAAAVGGKAAPPSKTAASGATAPAPSPASPRSAAAGVSGTGLVTMLRMPDVKESALLSAIETYEQQTFVKNGNEWMANDAYPDVLTVLLALLKHLPEPRPPVQLAELHVLGYVLQAAPVSSPSHNKNVLAMLEALVTKGDAIPILTKLLTSVNDDVKCEVLECLSPVVCSSHALVTAMTPNPSAPNICTHARREFLKCNGLEPLVNIVVFSTSEPVLERALVFLWGLLSKDERVDIENNGGKSIRAEVRGLGGLRAVLDLLYTDSLAILENVCMVIGYITREDSSKKEIREIGGLEKITATLRHPSDSIKTKMAGAVWNCAANPENRTYLRQLGAIPALLELLNPSAVSPSASADSAASEFVRENAAGALWNLSVDAENKAQILDYGGIPALIKVMKSSSSVAVVENVSGTLWNCSAVVETRPVIRKAGGIPVLLSLLNEHKPTGASGASRAAAVNAAMPLSEKIIENIAGTLRNCAINDQNKPLIREAGGVELILQKLKEALLDPATVPRGAAASPPPSVRLSNNTLDKLASTLWILTISPEIKHTVRMAGGIQTLTRILELSSPTLSGMAAAKGAKASASPFQSTAVSPAAARRFATPSDYYQAYFSPAALSKLPSATPTITVTMNIKEKIAGVLRNCSTVPENRPVMVECGVVRCLVSVILDCYSAKTVFPANTANHKNTSRSQEPSVQLKETVSSALWYLSRDDKVTPREQGGLELMCMFMVTPQQPNVVLEQAAGALSSLTVNNPENRDALRNSGGLQALVQLTAEKATSEYAARSTEGGGAGRGSSKAGSEAVPPSNTYAVLNALLTIRNSTISNEENLKYCADVVCTGKAEFGHSLLYVVQNGSEEAAREAALTIKNICGAPKVVEFFNKNGCAAALTGLTERATSDSVRRAAASALQALSRPAKK